MIDPYNIEHEQRIIIDPYGLESNPSQTVPNSIAGLDVSSPSHMVISLVLTHRIGWLGVHPSSFIQPGWAATFPPTADNIRFIRNDR